MRQFDYQILMLVRDKGVVFWSLAFPILLGTLFYVTFGGLSGRSWETVPVGVVELEKNAVFSLFLEELEAKDAENAENATVNIRYLTQEEAETALKTGEIDGIYYIQETPSLTVRKNGLEASILEGILSAYQKQAAVIEELVYERLPEEYRDAARAELADMDTDELRNYMDSEAYQELLQGDSEQTEADTSAQTLDMQYLQEVTLEGESMDSTLGYFFALIGMTCLFGAFQGAAAAGALQANVSATGARRSLSPCRKLEQIGIAFAGNLLLEFVCVFVLLLYLKLILKVGLGNHWGGMLLVSLMGCVTGVSMGICIGSIGRLSEGAKMWITVGVSLTASMLAGLMVMNVKRAVDLHCPLVNRLNPAALISDAFYCLNIYSDMNRYRTDLILLGVISAGLLAAAFCMIRRERYDSL